ncbi:undecaprenyldiphospho-muramoylpentapeptide beta-N-acetylglucosaminyltransferase [Marinicella sp. S1101]|uniref:undecaprenyldiphospho-muramoylpentapeptide beta-N-acetylglucosaminyltransferase n=1 Tax=Marinicella marina TaxID=2996016 RepID=UPI002260C790|nr:undecaprenyldiphospho-muramoylpentapeptide beta-N-acetylglucosaminyltransferase [Marinicella marina]MCX7553883.1 undecaprenyldiphospho-muramoylpentapeptide beta-N-acetylglucosaminyltransferase [Marinicella marina]MDJ1140375.1 undecaprenyldiphospho-muramoylpentapeptide beta-N-acetylglucosaminyltransferase [Marinicella marina]
MNFAIMAGGTGGHIFPGIAVAKSLQKKGHKIYWLGAQGGMEERIVRQHGIHMTLLPIKPLRGKGIVGLMTMPFRLLKGIWMARGFFKKNNIDAAISMGGYVAAPGGFATSLCATKLIVHEQNSVFGMTNKALARRANLVMTGFDLGGQFESQWVGNPVRESIEKIVKHSNRVKPVNVLVLGGSLGAQSLNNMVPSVLSEWIDSEAVKIKHQCGRNKKNATEAAYGQLAEHVDLHEFIHNMAAAYQWADICICRAGALTVAEITTVGIPTIFVPYPHAVDDHQMENALSLVHKDAAMMWQEKQPQSEFLAAFKKLMEAEVRLAMRANLAKVRKNQVSEHIAELCEQVVAA